MTFVFTWGLVGGRVCAKWTRPLSHAFEVHLQNVCRWSLSRVFFLRELVEDGPTPLVGHRSYLECTHCFCNYIFTVNIYTWHTHTRIYIYIYIYTICTLIFDMCHLFLYVVTTISSRGRFVWKVQWVPSKILGFRCIYIPKDAQPTWHRFLRGLVWLRRLRVHTFLSCIFQRVCTRTQL